MLTPPKDPEPAKRHAHALVETNGATQTCLVCSAVAGDTETLSSIPCTIPAGLDPKRVQSLKQRIEDERQRLEKLRQLRLLELEYLKLAELQEQRQRQAQRYSRPSLGQGVQTGEGMRGATVV